MSYCFQTIVDGMTSDVKFDENGRRSEIEVQIYTLNTQGAVQIGTWDTEFGIRPIPGADAGPVEGDSTVMSLRNRTFIVLTALVNSHRSRNIDFVPYFLTLL